MRKPKSDLEMAASEEKVEQSFYEGHERKYARLRRAEYFCLGLGFLLTLGVGACMFAGDKPHNEPAVLSGIAATGCGVMSRYFNDQKKKYQR